MNTIFTVKGMVRRIDDFSEIPFNYYNYNEDDFTLRNLAYFRCLSHEDETMYKNMNEELKRAYISNSYSIYLPLLSLDKVIELLKKDCCSFNYTVNNVYKLLGESCKDSSLALCLYIVLHEVGHYMDFLILDKSPYKFAAQNKEGEDIFNKENDLYIEFIQNPKKQDILLKSRMKLLHEYNNLLPEKKANDYARINIQQYYNHLVV